MLLQQKGPRRAKVREDVPERRVALLVGRNEAGSEMKVRSEWIKKGETRWVELSRAAGTKGGHARAAKGF